MSIKAGDRVKIQGLQARSDLNDSQGWVLRQAKNERWGVAVDNGCEVIAVRPCNLVIIEAPVLLEIQAQRKAIIRRIPSNLWARSWSFLNATPSSVVVSALTLLDGSGGLGIGTMGIMKAEYCLASGMCVSSTADLNPNLPPKSNKSSTDLSLLHIEGQEFCTTLVHKILLCHNRTFMWGGIMVPPTPPTFAPDGSTMFLAATGADNPYLPTSVSAQSITAGWIAYACCINTAQENSYQLRLVTSQGEATLYRLPAAPKLIKVSEDKIIVWCINSEVGITQVTAMDAAQHLKSPLSDDAPLMSMIRIGAPKCHKACPFSQATSISKDLCAFLLEHGDVQIRQYDPPDMLSDSPSFVIKGIKAEKIALSENTLVTLEEFGSLSHACVVRRLQGTEVVILQVLNVQRSGPLSAEYIYHVMFKPHGLDIYQAPNDFVPEAANEVQDRHQYDGGHATAADDSLQHEADEELAGQYHSEEHNASGDELLQNGVPEVPAAIAPSEAEGIVRAQWESQVESAIERSSKPTATLSPQTVECLVLTFSRHPRSLDTTLKNSQVGNLMREENADIQPSWANGAKVLIPGLTAEIWAEADPSIELGPFHAVVFPGDENDVMSTLQSLGRQRPRLKASNPRQTVEVALTPHVDCFGDATESDVSAKAVATESGSLSLLSSEAQTGSSSTGYEILARTEWLKAVSDAVTCVRVVYLPVVGLMIHQAPSPVITPRSEVIASDPGDASITGFSSINPRHFGSS